MKQVTVEELEQHLRERLDDVRNGESVQIIDSTGTIGTIAPATKRTVEIICPDPALRLQDFQPGTPLHGTGTVEWLISDRGKLKT